MKKKAKIMVVDDEAINVAVITSFLADSYNVISVSDSRKAMDVIRRERPDLLLLDVIMPEVDGFDVCQMIKQDPELNFIPVVMLTILAAREYHQRGIAVGADDFLRKPADKFELNEKIKALLRIKGKHDQLLDECEALYTYLDYIGILVAVLSSDYRLVYINKKGAGILGCNRLNIINRSWLDIFVSESYADYAKEQYSGMADGTLNDPLDHEYPILTITRKERLFRWHDSILKDNNGKISGFLISGEDITDKRMDETKIIEYMHELKRSNDLKDLFTDVLRHDLLNPAGIIKSFTELLEETNLDQKQLQIIGNMKKTNTSLIGLIEDAANLAKLESIENMTFVRLDIGLIAQETINNFVHEADEKEIDIHLLSTGNYMAFANPMIQGVFANILSNAIKYSPSNSIVKIGIRDIGEKWKIDIADQGDGIPDSEKEAVFERFNRLHKERIKGHGIGLAIVKRIMDLHGENIDILDNPEGKGTIFSFTLKKA